VVVVPGDDYCILSRVYPLARVFVSVPDIAVTQ